jgi:hypothetical protein
MLCAHADPRWGSRAVEKCTWKEPGRFDEKEVIRVIWLAEIGLSVVSLRHRKQASPALSI